MYRDVSVVQLNRQCTASVIQHWAQAPIAAAASLHQAVQGQHVWTAQIFTSTKSNKLPCWHAFPWQWPRPQGCRVVAVTLEDHHKQQPSTMHLSRLHPSRIWMPWELSTHFSCIMPLAMPWPTTPQKMPAKLYSANLISQQAARLTGV